MTRETSAAPCVCAQVVLATNRLDGRKYAIKKIKMSDQNPQMNTKILREVATLSRLQHQNIVRYFQAWCELGNHAGRWLGSEDSGDSEGEEGDESDWLTRSVTPVRARRR